MAVTHRSRHSEQRPAQLTDVQAPPMPDEDGPHDVPDDEVIQMTLPAHPSGGHRSSRMRPETMNTWKVALVEGAAAGATASLLSMAVLAIWGLRQAGSPFAATNAVNHSPGFEHRLSTGAMVTAYGALAAGFALGALLLRRRG